MVILFTGPIEALFREDLPIPSSTEAEPAEHWKTDAASPYPSVPASDYGTSYSSYSSPYFHYYYDTSDQVRKSYLFQ